MSFNVEFFRYFSKTNTNFWSQVFDYKPDDLITLSKLGHFFVIINTSKSTKGLQMSSIDNVLQGRNILTLLKDNFYSNTIDLGKQTVLERLKYSVEKTLNEYSTFEKIEIAVGTIINNVIYFAASGGTTLYLLRDHRFVKLLESPADGIRSTSGYLKNNDIVFIGTPAVFEKHTPDNIKQKLQENLESLEQFFTTNSINEKDSKPFSALVIKFNELTNIKINSSFESDEVVHAHNRSDNKEEQVSSVSSEHYPQIKTGFKDTLINLAKKLSDKKLYVSSDETPETYKKRKVSASVGLILLLVLFTSIFFGIRQKRVDDVKDSYQKDLDSAKHSLEEAENLAALNPDRARQLFIEAKGKVLGMTDAGIKDPELESLKSKIEASQGVILGEYQITPELFVDLGLLSEGFRGEKISVSNGTLYVMDVNGRKISKTVIPTKRSEIVAGPNFVTTASELASYQDSVYLLNQNGIFDVTNENSKVSDQTLESPFFAQAYAGNLYILEKSTSLISRMPGNGEVFGDKKTWLSESTVVDLSNASSWAIDGNIWVLVSGDIYRFSGGNRINFKLKDESFENYSVNNIFTNDETTFLYLLDKENGRVLVFTKEGEYKSQYVHEEIKNVSNFAVFENQKKMILLKGDKLLSVELGHI